MAVVEGDAFRGAALAGVRDSWVGSSGFWANFSGSAAEDSRGNCGRAATTSTRVSSCDTARYHALDIAAKCKSWLTPNPRAHYLEQDALNVAAAGAIVLAPPAWNVHGIADNYVLHLQPHTAYSTGEASRRLPPSKIVHFAGLPKPGSTASRWLPLFPRYFRARRHSPWHRPLTVTQRLRLAALGMVHRVQCYGYLRIARAILYASYGAVDGRCAHAGVRQLALAALVLGAGDDEQVWV